MERHFEKAEIIVAEQDGRCGDGHVLPRRLAVGAGTVAGGLGRAVAAGRSTGGARPGAGDRLTEECIRRCREGGIKTLALHTTDWMPVAKAMYERMGFVRDDSFDFVPT